ncbi:MAG: hypothetical protein KDF67_21225 [Ottowia sp.]|nr:hypothetical protein [Ottowia sp.]MCB2071966.1 hypothetical protein [Ottowia sp.]
MNTALAGNMGQPAMLGPAAAELVLVLVPVPVPELVPLPVPPDEPAVPASPPPPQAVRISACAAKAAAMPNGSHRWRAWEAAGRGMWDGFRGRICRHSAALGPAAVRLAPKAYVPRAARL